MNLGGKIPGNPMESKKTPQQSNFLQIFSRTGIFFLPLHKKFVVIPIKIGAEGVEVGVVWDWKVWIREFFIPLGMPGSRGQKSQWDQRSAPDPHLPVLAGCAFLGSSAQCFFSEMKGLGRNSPKCWNREREGNPEVRESGPGVDEFSCVIPNPQEVLGSLTMHQCLQQMKPILER